jgi:hypothetical protein
MKIKDLTLSDIVRIRKTQPSLAGNLLTTVDYWINGDLTSFAYEELKKSKKDSELITRSLLEKWMPIYKGEKEGNGREDCSLCGEYYKDVDPCSDCPTSCFTGSIYEKFKKHLYNGHSIYKEKIFCAKCEALAYKQIEHLNSLLFSWEQLNLKAHGVVNPDEKPRAKRVEMSDNELIQYIDDKYGVIEIEGSPYWVGALLKNAYYPNFKQALNKINQKWACTTCEKHHSERSEAEKCCEGEVGE